MRSPPLFFKVPYNNECNESKNHRQECTMHPQMIDLEEYLEACCGKVDRRIDDVLDGKQCAETEWCSHSEEKEATVHQ